MNSEFQVSVIIPFFGDKRSLLRAVDSVLLQTVPAAEIIVVDDGSSEALEFKPSIDSRLKVLRHDSNKGPAAARNSAIRVANCDVVTFLDADDFWLPQKIERQLATLEATEKRYPRQQVAVACGFVLASTHAGSVSCRIPVGSTEPAEFASGCWFSPGSTLMIRRDTLLHHGLFDEDLRRLEDFIWFLKFVLNGGKLVVCDQVGAVVIKETKLTAKEIDAHIPRVIAKARDIINRTAPKRSDELLALVQAYCALEIASAHWYDRAYLESLRYLLKSWMRAPRRGLYLNRYWKRGSLEDIAAGLKTVIGSEDIDQLIAPVAPARR